MTADEQLAHERQVAEILRIRSSKSSGLKDWLNSSVIATLVGVLGTGVIGAIVGGQIQERAKRNELDRVTREQRLSAQNAAVTKLLDLVGTSMSTADDLLVTVNKAYEEAGRSKADVAALRKWKVELSVKRDQADLEWRRQKRSLGYTLLYLFDSDAEINAAWKTVSDKADGFESCTREWYTANAALGTTEAVGAVCVEPRHAFEDSIEKLMFEVASQRLASR